MPTTHPPLTPARISAAKPGDEKSDASSGLRLRVSPNGVRSFRWAVRDSEGKQRWITLGRWAASPKPGHLTLSEARTWLERLKGAHRIGELERTEAELRAIARPALSPAATDGVLTVRAVAEDFLRYVDRERKRPEQARRPVEFDILPRIGDRPLASITTPDCRRVVEAVVARGSPRQAGVVLAICKQLFGFAVDRGDLEDNPAARLTNPRALGVVNNVCQRFLSAEEIRAFWHALDAYRGLTPTIRNGLKVLLLTGARSGELLKARIDEVDLASRVWAIPVVNQKLTRAGERNARPWRVPLAPTAAALLGDLITLAKSLGSPYVMASFHRAGTGDPLTEKALNHAMRRLFEGETPLLKFADPRPTPHDLRRTVRTGLGELGVPWHVGERCLNHVLPSSTYDVADYFDERRTWLERWDAHVQRLIA